MATRSAAFAVGRKTATGEGSVFTVPPSVVCILKSIQLTYWGADPSLVTVQIIRSAPGPSVRLIKQTADNSSFFGWQGWIALEPGSSISIYSDGLPVDYWISGAELPEA